MSTLGFNATRSGVPGFVTNSPSTQVFWNLDTNAGFPPADFYQASGFFPAQWVGREAVDTQAFPCPPPYPSVGFWCRYSDSAFIGYNTGVAFDPGSIGKTTAPTVLSTSTANLVLAVDDAAKFAVVSPPTQPYLVGLQLHKVGRTTGWTMGTIIGTCLEYSQTNPAIYPGTTVRLCQYLAGDPQFGLATFADSGSPVFRIASSACGYVKLYGILWGGGDFVVPPPPWSGGSVGKMFAFSPIGGVPFQQTGVQSAQDLETLNYTTAAPPCVSPTPTRTPTPKPCGTVPGPQMCSGACPNPGEVCALRPDADGCECRAPTPTRTPTRTSTPTRTPTHTPRLTSTPTRTPTRTATSQFTAE